MWSIKNNRNNCSLLNGMEAMCWKKKRHLKIGDSVGYKQLFRKPPLPETEAVPCVLLDRQNRITVPCQYLKEVPNAKLTFSCTIWATQPPAQACYWLVLLSTEWQGLQQPSSKTNRLLASTSWGVKLPWAAADPRVRCSLMSLAKQSLSILWPCVNQHFPIQIFS